MTDEANSARAAEPALVAVAQIAGAFGVKGEVRVRSFTDEPEACFGYGPLLDADGRVCLTPVSVRPLKDVFAVEAVEARTREGWEALRGTMLHAPRAAMPPTEDDDEVYVVDLVGCSVGHVDGRALGEVRAVRNFGAGDLLEVEAGDQTWLLPFTRADVPEIDLAARRLTAEPDEALLPDALQRTASTAGL